MDGGAISMYTSGSGLNALVPYISLVASREVSFGENTQLKTIFDLNELVTLNAGAGIYYSQPFQVSSYISADSSHTNDSYMNVGRFYLDNSANYSIGTVLSIGAQQYDTNQNILTGINITMNGYDPLFAVGNLPMIGYYYNGTVLGDANWAVYAKTGKIFSSESIESDQTFLAKGDGGQFQAKDKSYQGTSFTWWVDGGSAATPKNSHLQFYSDVASTPSGQLFVIGANGAHSFNKSNTATMMSVDITGSLIVTGSANITGSVIAAGPYIGAIARLANSANIATLPSITPHVTFTSTGGVNVNGISEGADGQRITVFLCTNATVVFTHESPFAGASTQRIWTQNALSQSIVGYAGAVEFLYDANTARWIQIGFVA